MDIFTMIGHSLKCGKDEEIRLMYVYNIRLCDTDDFIYSYKRVYLIYIIIITTNVNLLT